MIDIHCHLLYGVDDGAETFEMSAAMLEDAAKQGITDIIVTPHYRREMFAFDLEEIAERYPVVHQKAKELGINMFLGCECHVNADMLDYLREGRVLTLAQSDYVLTEFSYDCTYDQVRNKMDELLSNGYVPVIAHAERYVVFQKDPEDLEEFRAMGAKVQINANSVLGLDGILVKKTCKKILKKELADIVASDCHDMSSRKSHMRECMDLIAAKYGQRMANKLFVNNPRRILYPDDF